MMTAADCLAALAAATVAGSAAILVVLLLRRPLRRAFDAGAAYLSWALVPLASITVLLPAASIPDTVARVLVVPGSSALISFTLQLQGAAFHYGAAALLVLWGSGAAGAFLLLLRRQLSFERALGRLQLQSDGTYVAQTSAGLPAVIGILHPRIVLPADHAARFDGGQRLLVREHEAVHIARGDQLANMLALTLRCLFWFNPLVHWAAPRFRHEQELACDARVIARHPRARRAYGEALLGTRALLAAAPLTCQIGFGHPLRERIAMLKRPVPSRPRRIVGIALVLALVAGVALAANATKGDTGPPDVRPRPDALPDLRGFYPPDAKSQGIGGLVKLRIHVTSDGTVDQVEVQSSEPQGVFDASAIEFAKRMTFSPARKGGKPVATWLVLPIKFDWHDDKEPPANDGNYRPIETGRPDK
jgi:bla regulator protein blaR1